MKLYLATSCLQTMPMETTIKELMELQGVHGLQLCAGNGLQKDLKSYLESNNIQYMQHHNFSWKHYARKDTWQIDNETEKLKFNAFESNSVHPPQKKYISDDNLFWQYVEESIANSTTLPIFELMYPDEYFLGNDDEVNRLLDYNLSIAVDVSHVFIQVSKRALSQKTWKRIQEYDNIKEIHVSSNNGFRDSHLKIQPDTFGLDWAKGYVKQKPEVPLQLECYMHKLSTQERQEQIDIIRA